MTMPQPQASRKMAPAPALGADLQALGLPLALGQDWPARLREALAGQMESQRCLGLFMDSCQGCGLCLEACPSYLATGDPLSSPVGRLELLRQAWRQVSGRPRPAAPQEAEAGQPRLLLDWQAYFNQCALCRRCATVCPLGLDVSLVSLAARQALASLGLVPRQVAQALGNLYRTGNHQQVSPPVWERRLQSLEAQLAAQTGQEIKCPLDEPGAEALLIAPSADLLERPEMLAGYAKMFHAAGLSWTTSSYLNEADNWGELVSGRHQGLIAQRALEAAGALRARRVVWGESGRGWAMALRQGRLLSGQWSRLERLKVKQPLHVMELACQLLEEGAFLGRLRPAANQDQVVAYSDPCHLARSADLREPPRRLLAACSPRLVSLPRPQGGANAWCCGAGGGLGCAGLEPVSLAALSPLAQVLSWSQLSQGQTCLASACATCRGQLARGLPHFELDLRVAGVCELFGQALYPTNALEAGL